jgi:hypothetical protein
MEPTAELAGFFVAHAFWTLSEASTFDPILAYLKEDGERNMIRLVGYETPQAVAFGRDWIGKNSESATSAVLIFDGRINLEDGKCDAVIAEGHQLAPEARTFKIAIPYRQYDSAEGFAVHRPKFMSEAPEGTNFDELGAAFFRGVDQHEQGAAIWNAHLDESR